MQRAQWGTWTDRQSVNRRACGRRRHNLKRRQQAEARRRAMAQALAHLDPKQVIMGRGVAPALALAFGVSRTTAWRDLQAIIGLRRRLAVHQNGEPLYVLIRAYQGGPIISVQDPDGNEIRGRLRRSIIRRWRGRYW